MKNFLKVRSNILKLTALGVLLIGLPIALILVQNEAIFLPQASFDPNNPVIISSRLESVTNSAVTGTQAAPFTAGQSMRALVAFNPTTTGHYDAYIISDTLCDNPNLNSPPIVNFQGQSSGTINLVAPSNGRYCFVINAHSRADHSINDWNPNANPRDKGCGWDGKIHITGSLPGQIVATNEECDASKSKIVFWVGQPTTASSPNPSPSASASVSPATSSSINPVTNPASPIPSRNPRSSPFVPVHLTGECVATDFDCLSKDPIKLTSSLYTIGLGLVGGVGVLFMIMGAYMVLTSQGDPTKLQKGKEYIVYSIIGILLALFGYAFYQLITVDILHLPGFNR